MSIYYSKAKGQEESRESTLERELKLKLRAKKLLEKEYEVYRGRTPKSRLAHEANSQHLAGGVGSSTQGYYPYPIVFHAAQGPWLWDVDGNKYVDLNGGFGSLLVGHSHPLIVESLINQLGNLGTLYVAPSDLNAQVANLLCERFGIESVRFTNSGTEATHDALRVARAFTKRDKIVKVEGGYHGHHDEVLISVKPSLSLAGPADHPRAVPASGGIP